MKQTKKQIAALLDAYSPLHSFTAETGPCSYKRYSKKQLIGICLRLGIALK